MKLSKFVVYLKENRERFCEVQCWDQKPCEKCIFISTLNMLLINRKYAKMHYVLENSMYRKELTEVYQKHFLKENKNEKSACCII